MRRGWRLTAERPHHASAAVEAGERLLLLRLLPSHLLRLATLRFLQRHSLLSLLPPIIPSLRRLCLHRRISLHRCHLLLRAQDIRTLR